VTIFTKGPISWNKFETVRVQSILDTKIWIWRF